MPHHSGQTKDPGLLLNDTLAKLKHWKSKFHKCNKEKDKGLNALKEANM
jgi:hypothetical protein